MLNRFVVLCAVVSLMLTASSASQATPRFGRDGCSGTLHRDADRVWFGGARGEGESICMIDASQAAKVLKVCAAGKYCNVAGPTTDCQDSGECIEIKRVVGVTARGVSRRR